MLPTSHPTCTNMVVRVPWSVTLMVVCYECVSQLGMTPLLFASRNDHVEVVNALLAAGADVQAADEVGSEAMMEDNMAEKLWDEVCMQCTN